METVWTLASWVVDAVPNLVGLFLLLAGLGALQCFRVAAQMREIRARAAATPADDLV